MARHRAGLTSSPLGVPAVVVPVAATALLVLYPAVTLLVRSFDSRALTDTVASGSFAETLWFTTVQAGLSTLVTLALGLPLAGVLARRAVPGAAAIRAVVMVPFVLPTVVVGGAYLTTFDRLGLDAPPVDLRSSTWGIVAAHAFFNVAVVVRVVGTRWSGLDHRPVEAARTLGAGPGRALVAVTLPALAPAIAAAATITFVFSFTSYGVVRVLGGVERSTIETEIYRYAILRQDLRTATALAVVQLVAIAAVLALGGRRLAPVAATGARPSTPPRPWGSPGERLAGGAVVLGVLGYLALPVAVLVERSLRADGAWSLTHYRALADPSDLLPVTATRALANSLAVAVVATVAAVVVGSLAAFGAARGGRAGRIGEAVVAVPLAVSAVTVGLGMLVAFDDPPVDWRSSWAIVPLAHAMVAAPLVSRSVLPALRSVSDRTREAAAVLGASPAGVARTIDLPVAARAVAVGAGFAFAVSMGEFGATSFLARRADQLTAPMAVARLLGRPGEAGQGQAAALSVIVMLATIAAVALGDAASTRRTVRPS